jgi:hypothetical protein
MLYLLATLTSHCQFGRSGIVGVKFCTRLYDTTLVLAGSRSCSWIIRLQIIVELFSQLHFHILGSLHLFRGRFGDDNCNVRDSASQGHPSSLGMSHWASVGMAHPGPQWLMWLEISRI